MTIEERARLVDAARATPDPIMNRDLHALPLRSPERYRYAMTMADFILSRPT
jgi:hypothetical protein